MPAYCTEYEVNEGGQLVTYRGIEINAPSMEEAQRIASHLRTHQGAPVVVCGELVDSIPWSQAGADKAQERRVIAAEAQRDLQKIIRTSAPNPSDGEDDHA